METDNSKQLTLSTIIKILIAAITIVSVFITTVVSVKAHKLKSENSDLRSEYSQISNNISQASNQNTLLLKSLKEKQDLYNSKLSDYRNRHMQNGSLPKDNKKIAYLTFDDGPSENTDIILNTLKKYGIHATFFVNGHTDEHSAAMYKRILAEGDIIGNHTYSHEYSYVYKSEANFKADVDKLSNYVYSVTGQYPSKLFRFPGGSNNTVSHKYGGPNIMKQLVQTVRGMGYTYFDWNVDSTDASGTNIPKNILIRSVLGEARHRTKAVVLMHDAGAKTTSAEALPAIIEGLKQEGFSFGTLDEINAPVVEFKNNR